MSSPKDNNDPAPGAKGEAGEEGGARCAWALSDPAYRLYHDREWGVAVHDDRRLFELLLLEGAQAGLSWLTILKRRESYRLAYDGFDPEKIARWDEARLASLLQDPGIIRNKLKIAAARINARAFLAVVAEFGSFDKFIWAFVGHKPLQNGWQSRRQIPVSTPTAEAMSRALKKRGFKFVGPTICYAFMQAVGMVNDHLVGCRRYQTIKKGAAAGDEQR